MTPEQKIAIAHSCKLAEETMHPRFAWRAGRFSVMLTVNSGYE